MNTEIPFAERDDALDAYLAEIDRALDAIFLDEVDGVLQRIRVDREGAADDVAA